MLGAEEPLGWGRGVVLTNVDCVSCCIIATVVVTVALGGGAGAIDADGAVPCWWCCAFADGVCRADGAVHLLMVFAVLMVLCLCWWCLSCWWCCAFADGVCHADAVSCCACLRCNAVLIEQCRDGNSVQYWYIVVSCWWCCAVLMVLCRTDVVLMRLVQQLQIPNRVNGIVTYLIVKPKKIYFHSRTTLWNRKV